jgi:hypothetical protein
MAIEIKQEKNLWTMKVNEKFSFKTVEELQKFVKEFIDNKNKNAQYQQLKEEINKEKQEKEKEEFFTEIKTVTQAIKNATEDVKNGR